MTSISRCHDKMPQIQQVHRLCPYSIQYSDRVEARAMQVEAEAMQDHCDTYRH